MRTIIFTHADSDGICAGALALAAFPDSPVYFTNAVSILADIENAVGFDQAVITDIAVNISTGARLKDRIDRLAAETKVIYLDHHPLPEGFSADWMINNTASSASEMAFRHFKELLSPDMSRVALYGAIGDYRDDSLSIYNMVQNWDKRSLYYQAGTLSQGIEIGRRDYDWKRYLVMQLAKNVQPSDIPDLAKNAIRASALENELRLNVSKDVIRMRNLAYVLDQNACMSKAAIYARVYGGTPVGMSAEYRDHRDVYDFSLRAIGRINLNPLVSSIASRYGGNAGGHPLAAGGRIPAGNFKEFLLDLDDAIGEELSA
ncbi:DHHA1 domain-containing protein [Methanocella arvoryzae]|nr:DHHA1 domain-containing protein [Methanocella arvoryzae]